MPSTEDALKGKIVSLLQESVDNESLWKAFLQIHLHRITHGRLEPITEWSLSTFMPASSPLPNEVAKENLIKRRIKQKLPPALQGTAWDANRMQPDITLETTTAHVIFEIKGEGGHFHGTGQPLLFARYLVLTPPDDRQDRRRAFLLAAPERFFTNRPDNMRNWESWQLEFRRLYERDQNFYWGILLAEDIEGAMVSIHS